MKKVIFLLLSFFALTATSLSAQNPIPSWNVPVYFRANFHESPFADANQPKSARKNTNDYLVVPVTNLPAGGYLCSIIQNDKPIQSARFIVVK